MALGEGGPGAWNWASSSKCLVYKSYSCMKSRITGHGQVRMCATHACKCLH